MLLREETFVIIIIKPHTVCCYSEKRIKSKPEENIVVCYTEQCVYERLVSKFQESKMHFSI